MAEWFDDQCERVMEARWSPANGVVIAWHDLPDGWAAALDRVGRDLRIRQYGGVVERIDWVARYEAVHGYVYLYTDVTVEGRGPNGSGMSGSAALVDADDEAIALCVPDLVQDQVARARVAWPWGDRGGFMSPRNDGGAAVWFDRGRTTPIGHCSSDNADQSELFSGIRSLAAKLDSSALTRPSRASGRSATVLVAYDAAIAHRLTAFGTASRW